MQIQCLIVIRFAINDRFFFFCFSTFTELWHVIILMYDECQQKEQLCAPTQHLTLRSDSKIVNASLAFRHPFIPISYSRGHSRISTATTTCHSFSSVEGVSAMLEMQSLGSCRQLVGGIRRWSVNFFIIFVNIFY